MAYKGETLRSSLEEIFKQMEQLALTYCDYADMLIQRNGEGDRSKAMSLLDESLAISSELGMGPLMERALSPRDILVA